LTRGVLSAVRQTPEGVVQVQTDAPMNEGNSGGPILDMDGKVVGIAQQIVVGATGLNLGVATESIQPFLAAPASSLKPSPSLGPDAYEPDDAPSLAVQLLLDGTP